jgi:hypothetical protein
MEKRRKSSSSQPKKTSGERKKGCGCGSLKKKKSIPKKKLSR